MPCGTFLLVANAVVNCFWSADVVDGSVGEHDGDEVGLERSDVDVEGTIETEESSEGGDNLSDEAIEVGVGRALNVEGTTANVVDGLVVEHDSDIGVLEERVSGEHRVVRLAVPTNHE